VGGSKADLAAHLARLLVRDKGLARAVLGNEALLAKIGSKGFLPNDVLNKLQSGHGAWTLFDCAVLKLEAKLTDLAQAWSDAEAFLSLILDYSSDQ